MLILDSKQAKDQATPSAPHGVESKCRISGFAHEQPGPAGIDFQTFDAAAFGVKLTCKEISAPNTRAELDLPVPRHRENRVPLGGLNAERVNKVHEFTRHYILKGGFFPVL